MYNNSHIKNTEAKRYDFLLTSTLSVLEMFSGQNAEKVFAVYQLSYHMLFICMCADCMSASSVHNYICVVTAIFETYSDFTCEIWDYNAAAQNGGFGEMKREIQTN